MGAACHAADPPAVVRGGTVTVAVVGNPNAGKSALFNAMTGAVAALRATCRAASTTGGTTDDARVASSV